MANAFSPAGDDRIGNFRIVGELGRGAMGAVFLALDETLQRKVAIKVIHGARSSPALHERFAREAKAMALVNHPHVLSIHGFGEHEGSPYFVMEFVDGQTLEEFQKSLTAPLDIDTALRILGDICAGVSAIHAAGAIHRDLKPSNLLLDSALRARVADFGLAHSRDEALRGEISGTPGYMAPEIAFGGANTSAPTPQTDVYSLGCIAYQLLVGRPVFEAEHELGMLVQHATGAVTPPSSLRPDLPRGFDQALLQALAKNPADRLSSAELFRRCLLEARRQSLEPVRILLAEDDPDCLELLRIGLEREFPDAEVQCVRDGDELVAAFEQKPASAVILDLQMPALDGFAVTALLRARETAATVPIIVLTGAGGPQEWKRLATLGADRFMIKPVHLADLMTAVRNAIRERTSTLPPALV